MSYDALAIDHALAQDVPSDLTGAAARDAETLRTAAAAYQQTVHNLTAQFRAIDARTDLSEEGRVAYRAEAAAAWDTDAWALINDAQTVAERAITTRQSRVQLPPLHTDAVLAEVRLGNARADAQTALDRVPTTELLNVMRSLVGPDAAPELRHLLMSEHWPGLYLRSRGFPGLAAEWQTVRREFLPALLPPDGRTALAEIAALEPLAGIPGNLRGIHNQNRARYGVR